MSTLSVIIPLFNEQESLAELHDRLRRIIDEMDIDAEVLFIDDGSTDESFRILEDIRSRDGRVGVIRFGANAGKAAALQAGFDRATGDYVVTMDADLQDDPAEIPALLAALDGGLDLVSGWKKDRRDPLSKTIPSKVFNLTVRLMAGLTLHDFNCGLKAYRREVVKSIRIYGELHRYIPVLAKYRGFRVGEIPVRHHPRRHGRSKYGTRRFVAGFLDLLTVTMLTRYTMKPLHFFGSIGLLFCLAGGLVNLYVVYLWVESSFQNIQGRQPLLVGGVFLFLLGVQFISTGLLAELITASSMTQKRHYPPDTAPDE
ncbi:glycosyltransferase family 2 protein [Candidatus Latescibacterota bacterium]